MEKNIACYACAWLPFFVRPCVFVNRTSLPTVCAENFYINAREQAAIAAVHRGLLEAVLPEAVLGRNLDLVPGRTRAQTRRQQPHWETKIWHTYIMLLNVKPYPYNTIMVTANYIFIEGVHHSYSFPLGWWIICCLHLKKEFRSCARASVVWHLIIQLMNSLNKTEDFTSPMQNMFPEDSPFFQR